jgi:lysophospholipase
MNESTEAANSGIGGWSEGVTYMAGLSGGSWGTGTWMANDGALPTDLAANVSFLSTGRLHATRPLEHRRAC